MILDFWTLRLFKDQLDIGFFGSGLWTSMVFKDGSVGSFKDFGYGRFFLDIKKIEVD